MTPWCTSSVRLHSIFLSIEETVLDPNSRRARSARQRICAVCYLVSDSITSLPVHRVER